MFRSRPLPELPDRQQWWVLQSVIETNTGERWRIFHLSWGRSEDEAKSTYADDAASLDQSLMDAAIRRGDIQDEFEWVSPSKLVKHERILPVATLRDVKKIDRGLYDMLMEHEMLALEIERDGPSVIGGGFYELN